MEERPGSWAPLVPKLIPGPLGQSAGAQSIPQSHVITQRERPCPTADSLSLWERLAPLKGSG